MYFVKITVVKMCEHLDLIEKYENKIEHACSMKVGEEFISNGIDMPKGFCSSAWDNIKPYVFALSNGAEDLYDGWMKNKNSAMISCNDGFRPVSFYLETLKN